MALFRLPCFALLLLWSLSLAQGRDEGGFLRREKKRKKEKRNSRANVCSAGRRRVEPGEEGGRWKVERGVGQASGIVHPKIFVVD